MVLIKIFTDASVHKFKDAAPKFGLAVAMFENDEPYSHRILLGGVQISRIVDITSCSNPTVELLAAALALEGLCNALSVAGLRANLRDQVSVELYADYNGVEKYCSGKWKVKKLDTQFRKMALRMVTAYDNLFAMINGLKVYHVKGHSGNDGNEVADRLANLAACSDGVNQSDMHIDEIEAFVKLINLRD